MWVVDLIVAVLPRRSLGLSAGCRVCLLTAPRGSRFPVMSISSAARCSVGGKACFIKLPACLTKLPADSTVQGYSIKRKLRCQAGHASAERGSGWHCSCCRAAFLRFSLLPKLAPAAPSSSKRSLADLLQSITGSKHYDTCWGATLIVGTAVNVVYRLLTRHFWSWQDHEASGSS